MRSLRFLVIILSLCLLSPEPSLAQGRAITILHTNDLHSNFLGFAPQIDYRPLAIGADKTRGGYARLAAVLNRERARRKSPVITLDGGDFMMGTLFHTLAREESFELRLMKAMGYDAAVLGNHEFDLKPHGLARIIETAAAKNALPPLLLANAVFSRESDRDDTLEKLFQEGLVRPYVVIEWGGIRVGVFGVMGKIAAEQAPFAAPMSFSDSVEAARRLVRELREQHKVDLVICLSHSGVKRRLAGDEELAEKVPGIDLIVGGHSHTRLSRPLRVGSTLIVQAGSNGEYVGALDLVLDQGRVTLKDYRLHPVDSSIAGDPGIHALVQQFTRDIDGRILRDMDLSFHQTIAETSFDITIRPEESPLGNLIADASRWYANKHVYDPKDPATRVVIAIDSNGLIREDLRAGKTGRLAVTDIFRSLPMGIGADEGMGYPLVSCWLYAREIKKVLEVLTSVYPVMGNPFFLQVSGLKFTYNPRRMFFDRVTGIWIGSEEEGWEALDYSEANRQLYRVVANIYNAAFLSIIGNFTYGILTIVPKDRHGRPVANLDDLRIDGDKTRPGIQEVKQWIGLVKYFARFPDINGNGIPDVPDKYQSPLGRITVQAGWNPVALLAGGTWVTWAAAVVVTTILLILVLTGWLTVRRFRRKKGQKNL